MSTQHRLIVGGLPRGIDSEEVKHLVRPFGESRFALLDLPGDGSQCMAIVQLGTDMPAGARLRQRLNHRRLHGRSLWAWLTSLPWA
jgi:hypothetical protein